MLNKKVLDPSNLIAKITPTREIVIALGCNEQQQLICSLNWQQRLRCIAIVVALCAPFIMFLPTIANAAPITIEAENYSTMSGIWIEITADVGGGKDAGEITTGDWMEYKNIEVLIPATANYKITYRVASVSAVGRFTLHEAGGATIFDTVPLPMTGAWQKWTSVERIVSLPAGKHYFGVKALSGAFNINWIKVETTVATPPVVSSAPAVSSSSSSRSSTRAISSSSSSSKSSLSAVTHVTGPVEISWRAPTKRENGAALYIDELGGYEIRYKKTTDTQYTYVSINNPWAQSYKFAWLEGDYIFQIAVFDKNGIYSLFENIRRQ